MSESVPVTDLEFRSEFYPRNSVSDYHVGEITKVREGGHELPPIIVWRGRNWITDGVHRWTDAVRHDLPTIEVDFRDYADEAEFFKESCLLNSAHGLNFTSQDRLKVIDIGQQFGLRELDFAMLLRTSESYIKTLMPRYANVASARATGRDRSRRVERVPLKASTRHLSGTTITPEQRDAIQGNAPGTSYLLVARQLISGLEHDLLPPRDRHPVLWEELARLAELITSLS